MIKSLINRIGKWDTDIKNLMFMLRLNSANKLCAVNLQEMEITSNGPYLGFYEVREEIFTDNRITVV